MLRLALITAMLSAGTALGQTTQPTTQPATQPNAPQRILFVIDGSFLIFGGFDAARTEVIKAVGNLSPPDQFTIAIDEKTVRYFRREPATATPANKEAAYAFLAAVKAPGAQLGHGLAITQAFHMNLDVVWVINSGLMLQSSPKDRDSLLRRIREERETKRLKINTTLQFMTSYRSADKRFLWQIAQAGGGICLDAKGQPLTEDPDPLPAKRPPDPRPTGPSIFDRR